jgi:hypothetical protein
MGLATQNLHRSPFGTHSSGSEYILGLSSSSRELSKVDKLQRLLLTPKTKKWFLTSIVTTRELGLDCALSFEELSKLPLPQQFAAEMRYSSTKELPPVMVVTRTFSDGRSDDGREGVRDLDAL